LTNSRVPTNEYSTKKAHASQPAAGWWRHRCAANQYTGGHDARKRVATCTVGVRVRVTVRADGKQLCCRLTGTDGD
jgi:hypothetical protein